MNREINFGITDASNKNWHFKELRQLYEFLKTEVEFWSKKRELLDDSQPKVHPYMNAFGNFQHVVDEIESNSESIREWDDQGFQSFINNLRASQFPIAMVVERPLLQHSFF